MEPEHSSDGDIVLSDDEQENSNRPSVSLEPLSQHSLQMRQKGIMYNN